MGQRAVELTSITPIVLAAGDSARMGFPKALLPIGKETFLTRILNTLEHAGLSGATVVLGNQAAWIRSTLPVGHARILVNPRPAEGQLSSIRLALSTLDPACGGCMLWPVDQPGISENLVRELVRLFMNSNALLALPHRGDRRGHPAIFRRALFQEILDTPLQDGLKKMVLGHQRETVLLPTDEVAAIEDIDTPQDYYRLTGENLEAALARSALNFPR